MNFCISISATFTAEPLGRVLSFWSEQRRPTSMYNSRSITKLSKHFSILKVNLPQTTAV